MKYKAVFFDLDGTLLDTLADIANSMNGVLAKAGYPTHPVDAYKYFIGEGLEALVRKTLPKEDATPANIAKHFAEMKDVYHDHWKDTSRPYEGIVELLGELKKMNLPVCVLSNKAHEFTSIMIQELIPDYKFAIVNGSFPDKPKKPDPTLALSMVEKLGVKPEEVFYIGDTDTDMQTANNAGFYAVGALWGFRLEDELVSNGARILIKHPMDALQYMK